MSERIPYQGNALPIGLPGFGGGTTSVLSLPGIGGFIAQKFGPTVDAAEVSVPSPVPPAGNSPDNPTPDTQNPPEPATGGPGGGDGRMTDLCAAYDCTSEEYKGFPLVYAKFAPDPICLACKKQDVGNKYYPNFLTARSSDSGVFYDLTDTLDGKDSVAQGEWHLDSRGLYGKTEGTEWGIYSNRIQIDGKTFMPQDISVCVNGSTQTWTILKKG